MMFLLRRFVGMLVGWAVTAFCRRGARPTVQTFQVFERTDECLESVLMGRVFAGQLVVFVQSHALKDGQGWQYIVRTVPDSGERQAMVVEST